MAVDTPATIAVLGAGPIGLETSLYARFLGYEVHVYERDQVAHHVRQWGHVRMFSPFGMNRSPLGLAALAAQDSKYQPPTDDALLTGQEWIQRYLEPLSQSDLLIDQIRAETKVISVSRCDLLKRDLPGSDQRAESSFRVLLEDRDGKQWAETADIVIDTTGVFASPNWSGSGGGPAIGETLLRDKIHYALPDVSGTDRDRFAGRHTLVIGTGYSAATNIAALAALAADQPATRVTWIVRAPLSADAGPLQRISDDRLAARDQLATTVNRLATAADSPVECWPDTRLEAVVYDPQQDSFVVTLAGQHAGQHAFDQILANVGFRGDDSLYEELQVHECYATGGPIKLAATLLEHESADCLDQVACGVETLRNPEPNFYILGAKSYGRNSNFLFANGLEQIRALFALIGDREGLNLYETIRL